MRFLLSLLLVLFLAACSGQGLTPPDTSEQPTTPPDTSLTPNTAPPSEGNAL